MFVFEFDENLSKEEFYKQINDNLKHLIEGQRNWITNFSNASSLLNHGMRSLKYFKDNLMWVGFYMKDAKDPNWLFLGPFQGKVACTKIKFGRGVCGTAAEQRKTQVVSNVHEFPGHIACDAAANSEIVVPVISTNDELIGVLDLDSNVFDTFDEQDRLGMEEYCRILAEGSDFE